MTPRREVALLAFAVFSVSTAAVLIRRVGDVPPLVIAAYRLGLGTLLLWIPGLHRSTRASIRAFSARTIAVSALAGVLVAGHFATWIASLQLTNVASSLALVTAHPLAVAVGSRFLLGERISRRTAVGIAVGLGGIIWLAMLDHARGAGESLAGDALAFAGCLFIAGYFLCGRWIRGHVPLWPYVAVNYAFAALTLLGAVAVSGEPLLGYPPSTYAFLFLLALVPQGIGHTLLNRSLRYFKAPSVSLAILGEAPSATLMAWALLGERLPLERALAVATILGAVAVAVRPARDPEPSVVS
jgi:drug/metabolite transporter (DMT)-like permease